MSAPAPADRITRVFKHRQAARRDGIDDISAALLTASTSPHLPTPFREALANEGHIFLSSYAAAEIFLNRVQSKQRANARDEEGDVAAETTLFHRFLRPVDAVEGPWIRQVITIVNPPSQSPTAALASRAAHAPKEGSDAVAVSEGAQTNVAKPDVHSGAPLNLSFSVSPVHTITAVLEDGCLQPFTASFAAAAQADAPVSQEATPVSTATREDQTEAVKEREEEEEDNKSLWEAHLEVVGAAEKQFSQSLAGTFQSLAASLQISSDTATCSICHVRVPVYHSTLYSFDTPATRIATIGALTNRLIALMVRAGPTDKENTTMAFDDHALRVAELVRRNTIALRVLLMCVLVLSHHNTADTQKALGQIAKAARQLFDADVAECQNDGGVAALDALICGMERLCSESLPNSSAPSEPRGPALRRPPGVLVHCLQGVSRSPSVVLYYVMTRFAGVMASSHADAAAAGALVTFGDLLDVVRRARPCIAPNLCFAIELSTIWRRFCEV